MKPFSRNTEPRIGDGRIAIIESAGARMQFPPGVDRVQLQHDLAEAILGETSLQSAAQTPLTPEESEIVPFKTMHGRIGYIAAHYIKNQ